MNEPTSLMDESGANQRTSGDDSAGRAFGDGLRVRSFLYGSVWHVDGPGDSLPAGNVADVQEQE